jgi:hypothetical protein
MLVGLGIGDREERGDHIRRVGALHRRERAPVVMLLQRWFGI